MFAYSNGDTVLKIGQTENGTKVIVNRAGSISEIEEADMYKAFKLTVGASNPKVAMLAFRKYAAELLHEIKALSMSRKGFLAKAKPAFKAIKAELQKKKGTKSKEASERMKKMQAAKKAKK